MDQVVISTGVAVAVVHPDRLGVREGGSARILPRLQALAPCLALSAYYPAVWGE